MWPVATIMNSTALWDVILRLSGSCPSAIAIVLCESWDNIKRQRLLTHRIWGQWLDIMTPHAQGSYTLVDVSSRDHTLVVYRLNSTCRHVWLTQLKIISCQHVKIRAFTKDINFQLLLKKQRTLPGNMQMELSNSSSSFFYKRARVLHFATIPTMPYSLNIPCRHLGLFVLLSWF